MEVQMEVVQGGKVRERSGCDPVSSRRLRNPEQVLAIALRRVAGSFELLRQRSGATPEEFFEYLRQREESLKARLDQAWSEVNTAVYGQYLSAELDEPAYRQWRAALSRWLKLFSAAIELYRLHRVTLENDVRYEIRAA